MFFLETMALSSLVETMALNIFTILSQKHGSFALSVNVFKKILLKIQSSKSSNSIKAS